MTIALGLVLLVAWAALYTSRFRTHDIEGWQVVKVLKAQKQESKPEPVEVLEERRACAALAASVANDPGLPDSMRSVAVRIQALIEARRSS